MNFGRKLVMIAVLALLAACGGEGSDQPTDSIIQQVLTSPREYLHEPVILEGRVREVVGPNAFLLVPADMDGQGGTEAAEGSMGGNGTREGLLVIRADDLPRLHDVLSIEAVQVFEGDTLQVAGPLMLVDPELLGQVLSDDAERALVIERFEAEPALVSLVIDRVEEQDGESN